MPRPRVKVTTADETLPPSLVDILDIHKERARTVGAEEHPGDLILTDAFDAEATAEWTAEWMERTGQPGEVSYHICPHAEGEEPTVPCTDPSTGFWRRVI